MNKPDLDISKIVPFAVEHPDRIPKQRYYDPAFYKLECEKLWPRVWQMACRLEEIPNRGDYVVYENVGESVIVVRTDENTVKAFYNACRHRGNKLCKDRGRRPGGFVCSYHGWVWDIDGECSQVFSPELFDAALISQENLRLREVRLETWGGCAFINMDENAAPLRESIQAFADMHDAWHVGTLRTEWWVSARLPCNWKLAMEAFQEAYHVMTTHPQTMPPGLNIKNAAHVKMGKEFPQAKYWTVPTTPPSGPFDPKEFVAGTLKMLNILNAGMGGSMTHEKDVRIAQGMREVELPADPSGAAITWNRKLNDAVGQWHQKAGLDVADLNDVMDRDLMNGVNFCFPHFFLLPYLSSAASYRIRPLGPEECLFEIWSLTRFPVGEEPPPIKTPTPVEGDDPSLPLIHRQDFANLFGQQQALHSRGIDDLILSRDCEGVLSNNHRLIDGYLAGLGYDKLVPAAQQVSGPIDAPIRDLGF